MLKSIHDFDFYNYLIKLKLGMGWVGSKSEEKIKRPKTRSEQIIQKNDPRKELSQTLCYLVI